MNWGWFWYILLNESAVVIPLMTEFDEPFSGLFEDFKSPVEKLIPISDLLSWEKTKSMGYDGLR